MSEYIEIAFAALIAVGVFLGFKYGDRFLYPISKAKEYINWYKVGRIKQFATDHKIDIDEVIKSEELRNNKKIMRTWTEKLERKLSEDLGDIKEIEEPKK